MRILLSTYGSRGDVEPMAALAVALQRHGAEAVVSAPPDKEFADLLARVGVTLAPAFFPVREWASQAMSNPGAVDLPTLAAKVMAAQFDAISAAAEGCDAILAGGLFSSAVGARCVAEVRGLPYVFAAYCPIYLPSHHHGPVGDPGAPLPAEVTDNRERWRLNIQTKRQVFGRGFDALRAAVGLDPVEDLRECVFTSHPLLASDPVLSPWQVTDLIEVTQTGSWMLADGRELPEDLIRFLEGGPPPVYIGFGSMPMPALREAARTTLEAVRAAGRRAILFQGWAGLERSDDLDDCYLVGEVNQQALFARVAAVVHHGGAGTTFTAARAGAPQVVVPQVADQTYWAGRVAALGVGVAHAGASPSVESMAEALRATLAPAVRQRAEAVGGSIGSDGADRAAALLIRTLDARTT